MQRNRVRLLLISFAIALVFGSSLTNNARAVEESSCEAWGIVSDQPGDYKLTQGYGSLGAGDQVYSDANLFTCDHMDYLRTDAGLIPRYMLKAVNTDWTY